MSWCARIGYCCYLTAMLAALVARPALAGAIHIAVLRGNQSQVEEILAKQKDPANAKSKTTTVQC